MKKTVLIIMPSLKKGGGAEQIAVNLAENIKKEKITVKILTFYRVEQEHKFSGEHLSLCEKNTKTVSKKAVKLIKRIKEIHKIIRQNHITTVISFTEDANIPLILAKKIFNLKQKTYCSIRTNPERYPFFYKLAIRLLYGFATKIICVSRGVENILRKKFHKTNTKTIYNSVNVKEWNALLKQPLQKEHEELFAANKIYLNIGRLEEVKGQERLIINFKDILNRDPLAKLVIIGEGTLERKLKETVKLKKLENKVFFFKNQKNVFPFLKACHCFVFTSFYEGLPNILLSAAYSNCKILSTDCRTGPREILAPDLPLNKKIKYPFKTKIGFLLDPNNLENQFTKETILSDSKTKNISLDKFDKQTILNEWLKLL